MRKLFTTTLALLALTLSVPAMADLAPPEPNIDIMHLTSPDGVDAYVADFDVRHDEHFSVNLTSDFDTDADPAIFISASSAELPRPDVHVGASNWSQPVCDAVRLRQANCPDRLIG